MKYFLQTITITCCFIITFYVQGEIVFAKPISSTEDGTYTTTEVTAKNYYTPTDNSMCNGVFASQATVIVSGDTATIKLYVNNPTPEWGGKEDGVLKDIVLMYGGKEYAGSTTVLGFTNGAENPSAPKKKFSQGSDFFGIVPGSTYACDEVVISNVPVSALQEEFLEMSIFVNLMMNSTQKVKLDLTGWSGTPSTPSAASTSSSASTPATTESTPATTQSIPTTTESTITPSSTPSNSSSLTSGNYIAGVKMHKLMEIENLSMCDGLFHNYAGITVEGDLATLKLYVVDPIPEYVKYGTPLKDIVFKYDDTEYVATYKEGTGGNYSFDVASGFIEEAGIYSTAEISVTLPSEAISTASDGTLVCEAYINVVMNSTQSFFVMLSGIEEGTLTSSATTTSGTSSTTVEIPTVDNSVEEPTIQVQSANLTQETSFGVSWDNRFSYLVIACYMSLLFFLTIYMVYITKRR